MATTPRVRLSPDERRSEIAEAAKRIALRDGIGALTLRQVAAGAGVTPALVAHYAPSMEELVADTFATVVGAELAELESLVADVSDASERLRLLLHTLLDGRRDDVTLVWVQAWALGGRNDVLAARVREHMDAWQAFIARTIELGIRDDAFPPGDAGEAAWQILGMIDGVNAQSLVRWRDDGERFRLMLRAVEGVLGLPAGALA
ncbi:TetR family transcriptional regulator [Pseudoclavibacter chungangensis]|uniref:TetR family transcriptional regulator n=1 Tax=Pseudoclavibacter chungangensis TaxID=587635 RepID=A0A7J5C1B1_9MICO|nr:TetR family transcriptional regulator C-terminal domain-containing protein [Pseudoclavibacter chungangensis]KAB1662418.1 TetR family transcriptional regulator [Pseudoclavibacter chungangensis]NYJ68445.1 AcrR family transcriptional regulator [Pseudoclavibacter chungangensis]